MDVRLIIWGVFGGLGFVFFFMLIELLRRFNSTSRESLAAHSVDDDNFNINNNIIDSLSQVQLQSSSTTPSFCFPSSFLPILRDFSYEHLHRATNGFAPETLLKQGPFGKLHSGSLKDEQASGSCSLVIIKCLESREVYNHELQMVAALNQHNNKRIVELVGMCTEEKMLVFRQLPNGDLSSALKRGDEFKSSDGDSESSDSTTGSTKPLDWITRFKIANGLAEALAFLHHECSPPVIHRDVKASSVLLDEAYEVRLGSFTKSCIQQGGDAFPVFDIYCFGKVLLDLISGLDVSGGGDGFTEAWLQKAMPLMEFSKQEEFLRLVDPMLVIDEDHVKELMLLAVIARSCLDPQQVQHQSMSNIHQMLQNPAFFLAVAGH